MKRKYLEARLFGGLGNQMFIYAFAYALSRKNNLHLRLDAYSGFINDHIYNRTFQLDKFFLDPSVEIISNLNRTSLILRKLKKLSTKLLGNRFYLQEKFSGFNMDILDLNINSNLILEGYWQCEKYFLEYREELLNQFTNVINLSPETRMLGDRIRNENSVVVHIRFFDEPKPISIHKEYYKNAISYFRSRSQSIKFYVFSDNINRAKLYFKNEVNFNFIDSEIADDLAYLDLWSMSNAKNFILSNSTYCWWSAWLASSPDKIVRPKDVSNNTQKDFYPESWLAL